MPKPPSLIDPHHPRSVSTDLIAPQPAPVHNDHPASWDLVVEDLDSRYGEGDELTDAIREDMRGRDRFGFEKYGVRIQPHNGRDNLVDAYQELLDSLVYFRSALYEEEDPRLKDMYWMTMKVCRHIRRRIMQRDGE